MTPPIWIPLASLPLSESPTKERLDLALVARGLVRSRSEARERIRSGAVSVGGFLATKPGQLVAQTDHIDVAIPACRYVGRGGLKLDAVLSSFAIDADGKRCLDVGSSTGGFTDCLLQRSAGSVTAVDVGHGQMAPSLLADPRVRCFEGVNARSLRAEDIGEARDSLFDIVAVDLSFISLTLVLPALYSQLVPGGYLLLLIKPQFEVGREGLGKRGIVTDKTRRQRAVTQVCDSASRLGLLKLGVIECPIRGGDGNCEYLAAFSREQTKR